MKKLMAVLIAVAMMLAYTGCTTNPASHVSGRVDTVKFTMAPMEKKDSYTIGIIQFSDHTALNDSREGFLQALKDNNYIDGINVKIDFQNGQNDPSNLKMISQGFVQNKVDLILAIATTAAQSAANETSDIPILITAVTDAKDAGLVGSNDKPNTNVTGTSDASPIAAQIDLMLKFDPDIKTIGLLYNSGEANSTLQINQAIKAIEALGLTYIEGTVTSTNDIQPAIESIIGKVDAIYVPTDNTIASAMPTLAAVAIREKKMIIAGEENQVFDGALATIGVNYYALGYQTGEMAVRILKGEATPPEMAVQTQKDYALTINRDYAEAIGITIPEDLLSNANLFSETK